MPSPLSDALLGSGGVVQREEQYTEDMQTWPASILGNKSEKVR